MFTVNLVRIKKKVRNHACRGAETHAYGSHACVIFMHSSPDSVGEAVMFSG